MKPYFLLLLLFGAKFSSGQSPLLSIGQIDSLALAIDSAKGFDHAVADGTVRIKGKRKPIGGFSDTYYLDTATKMLTKVQQGKTVDYRDYSTYYFNNNQLILVVTTRYPKEGLNSNALSTARYYFQNDTLIHKVEQNTSSTKPEHYIELGRLYLRDTKSMFSL